MSELPGHLPALHGPLLMLGIVLCHWTSTICYTIHTAQITVFPPAKIWHTIKILLLLVTFGLWLLRCSYPEVLALCWLLFSLEPQDP